MAKLGPDGSVIAGCSRCEGGVSTFEWKNHVAPYGFTSETFEDRHYRTIRREFRLFRCAGCGRGGLGIVTLGNAHEYPKQAALERFHPDVPSLVKLPSDVPSDIAAEFVEGEWCMQNHCHRAAAAMFRSALEKTLSAAGYKPDHRTKLYAQIEAAASDGSITDARRRRAHDEIRVLGNDVLHDAWREVDLDAVILARDYTQRIIEDFYDHRATTLGHLRAKGRIPAEDTIERSDPA